MHGEDRDANIDDVHVKLCHVLGNGSATAGVDGTQFTGLPDDTLAVQNAADLGEELG